MKVYVITSGEYSDYGIDAVFTDKSLAEEYVDRNPSRRIETYEANKEVPEPMSNDYVPTVKIFREKSPYGIIESTIIFVEKR